jgi:muconate cycloisomerase
MIIGDIRVTPLKIPRKRAPRLGGRKTDDWASHVVVEIQDEQGRVGVGECRPHRQWSYETLESAATTLQRYLAPALVGQRLRIDRIDRIHRLMDAEIAPNIARGQPIAKAAIDLAIWDLLAKAEGRSVASLLGVAEPVLVRTNALLSPVLRSEAIAQAEAAREAGFTSFKLNLGHPAAAFCEVATEVKRIAGDDGYVLCEGNQGFDFDDAVMLGRHLSEIGVDAFEQPLPANHIADLRELKNQVGVPIQLDESIFGPDDLREFIKLDAVDAVTLKISKAGGLTPALEMARIAKDAGLGLAGSGLAEAGVGLAASAVFFASLGLTEHLTLNGPQLLVSDIVEETLMSGPGVITVPRGPGFGVTMDLAALFKYRCDV